MRNPYFSATFATIYVVLYYVLFLTGASEQTITIMFAFSPLIMLWMVVTILKHGKFTGRELNENEEWGYQDKQPWKNIDK